MSTPVSGADFTLGICNKCKREVPPENDAIILDYLMTGNPLLSLALSRHLLPVVVDGQTVCKGSPSRAQYLEGQPRDTRANYPWNEELGEQIRAAYPRLQALAGTVASALAKS